MSDPLEKVKEIYALRHWPEIPELTHDGVTIEVVEAFLFHQGNETALRELTNGFLITCGWSAHYGANDVTFTLRLWVSPTANSRQKIEISPGSRLWQAVATESKIEKVVILVPYPEPD